MWVKVFTCRSLADHARPESLPHLIALLQDSALPVRIAVVDAFDRLALAEARSASLSLQADPNSDVRQTIERVLRAWNAPPSGQPAGGEPGEEF